MYDEISTQEAKTKLADLLRQVKAGKRFTITDRGKPVANLVPTELPAEDADEAVNLMLAFKRISGVEGREIEAWIEAGRR